MNDVVFVAALSNCTVLLRPGDGILFPSFFPRMATVECKRFDPIYSDT